jgi:glycosyltransferase involved in cell wall biosynthesis
MQTKNIKVALIHDWLTGFGGAEQVLLSLHQLFPEAPIYTSVYNPLKTPQFSEAKIITSYLQKIISLNKHHQIGIPLMGKAFESLDLKDFDLLISDGTGFSKGIISQPNQVHISYCHTPIRYIWNLGGDNRSQGWLRSQVAHQLRIWDVVSASRVDYFIANSQNVAQRISKIYRQPSTVIYPPVNTNQFQVSDLQPEAYFLSVGRLVSYKRIDLIVQASLKTRLPLKIVGDGPEATKLHQMAESAPWIQFLGQVSNQKLQDLYSKAKAFIFAAEEDFGIVPVEAMSCGRPVIALAKGGALETVKEGISGTFFYESNTDSLAAVLEKFDSKMYDPSKVRKQAEKFSQANFQKAMLDFITKI